MSDIIRVRCGGCDVKIKAPLKYQGRRVNCPQCGSEVRIPTLDAARSAQPAAAASSTRSSAVAPVLLPSAEKQLSKPAAAKPVLVEKEQATTLGDDAFLDKKPAARKPADDEFADMDLGDFEDYGPVDDYGAPPPKRKPSRSSRATAKPARKKKAKPVASSGGFAVDPSIIGGIAMMIGAVVWFVLGLKAGIIFFYPPVLFVIGIVAFVKGLID
jgi:hypothetical protein